MQYLHSLAAHPLLAPVRNQFLLALWPIFRRRPRLDSYPIKFNASAGVEGFLDKLGPDKIQGWLCYKSRPEKPVVIAVYDDERYICSVTANDGRPDLARKGKENSACGFALALPEQLCDGNSHDIDIRLAGTAISLLPNPPLRTRFEDMGGPPLVDE